MGGGNQAIVAGDRIEPIDTGQFGQAPPGAVTHQHGNEVDGLGDQRARHVHRYLLNELFEPRKRADGRPRMHGGDAAGMPGVPSLEKIEGFRAAHFADHDAVGTQSKRGAHQIGERDVTCARAQRNHILDRTAQLARIL